MKLTQHDSNKAEESAVKLCYTPVHCVKWDMCVENGF